MRTARHLQVVTSDGQSIENTCHYRSRELLHLSKAGLTNIEEVFFFRYFVASAKVFLARLNLAEGLRTKLRTVSLGEHSGSDLIDLTEHLLDAIQTERCGDFSFMPTECPVCSRFLSEED